MPADVVADEERSTQLYVRPGTSMRTRCIEDGVPIPRSLPYAERFARPWALGPGTWGRDRMLMLTPAGANRRPDPPRPALQLDPAAETP